jgi:hypothetical protein
MELLFFAPVANVVLSAVRPQEEGIASGALHVVRQPVLERLG